MFQRRLPSILTALFLGFTRIIGFCFSANAQTTPDFVSAKALKSSIAADAVGVNTHLNYTKTIYFTGYETIIKPRLVELGTKHIRDHFGNAMVNSRYADLAHLHGIKLLLINHDNGESLEQAKAEVIRLNSLVPAKPVVEFIEPANERDNGWKQDWPKLCSYMLVFNDTFRSDPVTKEIPLLGPSLADTKSSALALGKVCKDASDLMDLGNLHAYSGLFPESPGNGGWGISFRQAIENYGAISSNNPIIETESGFKMSEGAQGHPAVSETTAAKYSPRLVLERIRAGVNLIYFYQLINDNENFGLLNNDGSPRLQFTALKNFIALMKDEDKNFVPASLSYKLKGDTTSVRQMLFQKSNGKFMLILWQGISGSEGGFKNNDYKDISNPDKDIKLILSKKAKSVKLYRPSFDKMPLGAGTKSVKTFTNQATLNLSVPDHILVAEIEP